MKFNIYFTVRGPAGQTEAPNNTNPVEADSLKEVLQVLGEDLPGGFGLGTTIVSIRIEEHTE